jgi:hypothetical protein
MLVMVWEEFRWRGMVALSSLQEDCSALLKEATACLAGFIAYERERGGELSYESSAIPRH